MICTHNWTVTSECPRCLRTELEAMREYRDTLLAEVERLRAALAPFAALSLWPDDVGDEVNEIIRSDEDWDEEENENVADEIFIRRGVIRAARNAMGGKL